ncbi:MAG TPA: tetratricopeptide repeat protein [Terriglobales bacterium]
MSWNRWRMMRCARWGMIALVMGVTAVVAPHARAGDLKINLPRRSHLTPVQRLNREGVEAVKKRNYKKAESLFYKAYLLDPNDPFTLNNLGYTSELQGQVERAQNFYVLAAKQATDAIIDQSTSKLVKGRPINEALAVPELPLQINHDNVEAVRLLSEGRGSEADLLLQQTLKKDPNNVFTLNNLGVAKEMQGESLEALQYYRAAADRHSSAAAVVTIARSWRGKAASDMAAENAKALNRHMETHNTPEARVAELNLRGVSAVNRNDPAAANEDFRKAYAIDPSNAFALNNIGYVSELEGDRETAEFFYNSARKAAGANEKVVLATRRAAEGRKLFEVAEDSDTKVETKVGEERAARPLEGEPIGLRHRDNSMVQEPSSPPAKPLQPVENPLEPPHNR